MPPTIPNVIIPMIATVGRGIHHSGAMGFTHRPHRKKCSSAKSEFQGAYLTDGALLQSLAMADLDDIREFLIDRKVDAACPRCRTDRWTLNNAPTPWAGLWGTNESGAYSLDASIFPVAMLTCNNCGFVSLHSRHFIDEWKLTKGKK